MTENLVTRAKSLREELARVEAALEAAADPNLRDIANIIHDLMCRYNHTDQCAWFYEQDAPTPDEVWQHHTHAHYFNRAKRLTEKVQAVVPVQDVEEVLSALLSVK